MKKQLRDNLTPVNTPPPPTMHRGKSRKLANPEEDMAKSVFIKIEEGDFRGAIRLVSSADTLADYSDETYKALCSKHPPAHPNSYIPPDPNTSASDVPEVSNVDVLRAVKSFPNGSAGGPDKLRPQHLKHLIQHIGDDDVENPLISVLAEFCSMVLRGDVPQIVRPFFFGASLSRRSLVVCARLQSAVPYGDW